MNDEETVQLTINLSLRTLVGCGQLLERQGNKVDGVSLEVLVEGTITSMIPWFERKGWIAPVPDPKQTFLSMFGEQVPGLDTGEPNLEINLSGNAETPAPVGDSFQVGEDVEAAVQARLREQALERTKRPIEPAVVPDVEKPGKINLLKINRMDIGVLSTIAPKDVMIEKVTKGLGDTVYRAAVEIVYTSLAPELWGTSTAEQAIKDMMARHEETP
jgi:hypothetical protein